MVRYALDPGLSRFTVKAFASGLFSSFGHNPSIAIRDFSGEAQVPSGGIENGAFPKESLPGFLLQLRINARSLAVTDEVSDKDRREMERVMNQEVLETERYPEIRYDASRLSDSSAGSGERSGEGPFQVNLDGELFLHGMTRRQPVPARVFVSGDTLRAQGEFSVRQTEFGIKLVSVAGGALKLKDELKCSFDIVAHKMEPQ